VLIKAAREKITPCVSLWARFWNTPDLADRLLEALRPELVAVTETIAARRCGGEASPMTSTWFKLGRLLSDLFRHRLLLQFLVVGVGQRAPRTFSSPTFPRPRPAEIFRPRTCQQHMANRDMYRQGTEQWHTLRRQVGRQPMAGCR